jgi:hypothetical protein
MTFEIWIAILKRRDVLEVTVINGKPSVNGLITEFFHNTVVPYSEPPKENVRHYL